MVQRWHRGSMEVWSTYVLAAIVGAVAGIGMVTGWHTEETNKEVAKHILASENQEYEEKRKLRRMGMDGDHQVWHCGFSSGQVRHACGHGDSSLGHGSGSRPGQVRGSWECQDFRALHCSVHEQGVCDCVYGDGRAWRHRMAARETRVFVQFAFEIVGEIKRCWNVPELV